MTTQEAGRVQPSARGIALEDTQSVKQHEVHQLVKSGDGVVAAGLVGNGFTYRHDWGKKHGQWVLNLNWGAIKNNSRVMVSIAEGLPGGPEAGKFIGSARYTLHNVAMRDGTVSIWVDIQWGSDIPVYVDYLVVNP